MLAIADDISGAAEVAMGLSSRATRTVIVLGDRMPPGERSDVPVFDLDTRRLPPDVAAERVADVVGRFGSSVLLKKIDSTLRGNVAAETAASSRAGRGMVVAPARPTAGRTVIDGVVRVDGVPLHETDTWRVEVGRPPATVAAAFGSMVTRAVGLDIVRGDPAALVDVLRAAVERGVSPICDAELDDDLDRIVNATMRLPDPGLVGSGGIADALGRYLGGGEGRLDDGPVPANEHRRLLIVVGTAAPEARDQIDHLVATRSVQVLASDVSPSRIENALEAGPTVVTLNSAIVESLARLVSEVPGIEHCDLVLTGGETARRVLEAQGIGVLWPVREVHPGAVDSRTADGRSVVTRPGNFGGIASLTTIVRDWEIRRCSH